MTNQNKVIAVKEETKQKLDSAKLVPEEHYDSVINRVLDKINGGDS